MRKTYPPSFKMKIALEACKEEKTYAEIGSEYGVHPNQVKAWRDQLLDSTNEVFRDRRKKHKNAEPTAEELFQQIGELQYENDWLKKKLKL